LKLIRIIGVSSEDSIDVFTYTTPLATDRAPKQLVVNRHTPQEQSFVFYDRIEIGRFNAGRKDLAGILLVMDPTVSSHHCIINQTIEGHCFIRDVSRNGTRLDGRRLIPNLESEIKIGQRLSLGNDHEFLLAGDPARSTALHDDSGYQSTLLDVKSTVVTVLVGDIRDYTVLVQEAESTRLQNAIQRVFQKLEDEVQRMGGTVKEYRGDAIFAFWEENLSENQAADACRAAVSLEILGRRLAEDESVWDIPNHPLHFDWALATGPVTFGSIGDGRPSGLSAIGEPVVLAFRIEKFANEKTGSIVVCEKTREKAAGVFQFIDLGQKQVKGFSNAVRVFALHG
jgi:class 3 adenylate cyclase